MAGKVSANEALKSFEDATNDYLKSLQSEGFFTLFNFAIQGREVNGSSEDFIHLVMDHFPTKTVTSCSAWVGEFPGIDSKSLKIRVHAAVTDLIELWKSNQMKADGINLDGSDDLEDFANWMQANSGKYELMQQRIDELFDDREEEKQ